ncbi:MAG TPA: DUF3828 domain-containing protein [Fibrobacteria bacterium]|nr:DUF3828 domain-containing protein [Fibrobacteria bacterium]
MKYSALKKFLVQPLFLCLLLGDVNACSRDSTSAKSFLTGLYAGYQSPRGPDHLGKAADTLFTPELLALIRRDQEQAAREVGLLDSDPICDCQDFEISNVRIQTKGAGKSKQEAEVAFTNSGRETRLGFTLAGDGKRWRIADIRTSTRPSMYRFLQNQLSPPPGNK